MCQWRKKWLNKMKRRAGEESWARRHSSGAANGFLKGHECRHLMISFVYSLKQTLFVWNFIGENKITMCALKRTNARLMWDMTFSLSVTYGLLWPPFSLLPCLPAAAAVGPSFCSAICQKVFLPHCWAIIEPLCICNHSYEPVRHPCRKKNTQKWTKSGLI